MTICQACRCFHCWQWQLRWWLCDYVLTVCEFVSNLWLLWLLCHYIASICEICEYSPFTKIWLLSWQMREEEEEKQWKSTTFEMNININSLVLTTWVLRNEQKKKEIPQCFHFKLSMTKTCVALVLQRYLRIYSKLGQWKHWGWRQLPTKEEEEG